MDAETIIEEIKFMNDVVALRKIIKVSRVRMKVVAQFMEWHVGQQVQLLSSEQHRKPFDTIGTICKVNQVNLKVDFGKMGLWDMPKSITQKVKE